jgi:branched-chain amino acid transport system substrate-binding protein
MTRFTLIYAAIIAMIGVSGFRPQGNHVKKAGMNRLEPAGDCSKEDPIKIGFLVADSGALGREAIHAAQLAISQANEEGGFHGRDFKLVIKSCAGPWGIGSKASVSLVYDDEVWVIVGSVDGRNAHLAEQVAAKSQIVFISTRASDPTLSRAFVPWYFRCVPDDVQQAAVLLSEIKRARHDIHIIALAEDNYDARTAAQSFEKTLIKEGYGNLKVYYPSSFEALLAHPGTEAFNTVVLFGKGSVFSPVLQALRSKNPGLEVYGALSVLFDDTAGSSSGKFRDHIQTITPRYSDERAGHSFSDLFNERYHYRPGVAGAYALDGTNLVIAAIRKAGLDKKKIRDALKESRFEKMVTGPGRFNEYGNRVEPVEYIIMK